MATIWVDTANKDALWNWFRPRYQNFMRAMFSYVRNNPAATISNVAIWVNQQPVLLDGIANTAIVTNWITNLGLTNAQALQLIRDVTWDKIIEMCDPAGHHDVISKEEALRIKLVGDITNDIQGAADYGIAITRDPTKGNYISKIVLSGTVDGSMRTWTQNFTINKDPNSDSFTSIPQEPTIT